MVMIEGLEMSKALRKIEKHPAFQRLVAQRVKEGVARELRALADDLASRPKRPEGETIVVYDEDTLERAQQAGQWDGWNHCMSWVAGYIGRKADEVRAPSQTDSLPVYGMKEVD